MAFRVTYDVVTEDSAVDGGVAESGYYSRGGWKHDDASDWTLHEVVSEFGRNRAFNAGSWFSTEGDINYRTGEQTSYCIHPPRNITPASYARIARILGYRQMMKGGR